MRRHLLFLAATSFWLAVLLFTNHQEAQAQTRVNDLIRFMSAIRGGSSQPNITDPYGNWCVSKGWHESYPGHTTNPNYPYPDGPRDAADEVSQWGSPGWPNNCHSAYEDPVDLATNGTTDGGSNCTTSAPCPSLLVIGQAMAYAGGCTAIEADLYDYTTYDIGTHSGDWKGKQRILHAQALSSSFSYVISVSYFAWYFSYVQVGTLKDDNLANCPITGPHAHHDFMLPTTSQNCVTNWNTTFIPNYPNSDPTNPDGKTADLQRQNPDHYVHYLRHAYGVACVVPGPDVANWLLRSGGELDSGNGAGVKGLATTGTPVDIAYTCFTQSTWCGYMRVYKSWLVAAYLVSQGMSPIDYFNSQQKSIPPSGSSQHYFWYGPDAQGYYWQFWWLSDSYTFGVGSLPQCSSTAGPTTGYWVDTVNSAPIACNTAINRGGGPAIPYPRPPGVTSNGWANDSVALQTTWSQFRGMGGVNPTIPETDAQLQQAANNWVLGPNWDWAIAKPYFDNANRSARGPRDLATLEIKACSDAQISCDASDPGNSFDGKRW